MKNYRNIVVSGLTLTCSCIRDISASVHKTQWVNRYDLYSTLHFASGRVAYMDVGKGREQDAVSFVNFGHGSPNGASAGMRWSDRRNRHGCSSSSRFGQGWPYAAKRRTCESCLASHKMQRTLQAVQLMVLG